VKLRYFAWVRERIGKPEEEIDPPAGIATVADLMTWLSQRGEEYAHAFENPKVIRAAIDRAHVRADAAISDASRSTPPARQPSSAAAAATSAPSLPSPAFADRTKRVLRSLP
jgi:sulfur-carrier protein